MSNDQKQNELSPEEETIRDILSKRINKKAYWTLKEGINYFLTDKDKNNFPLQGIIDNSLFEIIKRDIETQRLETFNSVEEIKEILDYDPVADFEKIKSQRSDLRKAEMRLRNLKRYGSIDKEMEFSFNEIEREKLHYFCSKIKIKPVILILYIIEHIDLFSSEIEIPPKIEDIFAMVNELKDIKPYQEKFNPIQNYTFTGEQIKSWEDIEIVLISHDTVEIKMGQHSKKLTFQQLGMANKQNPEKPKKVWEALKVFANLNGTFPNQDYPEAQLENAKDRVKDLNKDLKHFFNIQDNIYKEHYKKNHCWSIKFRISSRLEMNPDQQSDPSIFETEIESAKRSVNLHDSQLYNE